MSMKYAEKVKAIIEDAGGEVIGRTRLQKIAYLLSVTGLEDGFTFSYKHYGPFSEEVAAGARYGRLLRYFVEQERPTGWGGFYSIYSANEQVEREVPEVRQKLVQKTNAVDSVVLELTATAVLLAKDGLEDPWGETARRKPEKSEGDRLDRAKALLRELHALQTPKPLPAIGA